MSVHLLRVDAAVQQSDGTVVAPVGRTILTGLLVTACGTGEMGASPVYTSETTAGDVAETSGATDHDTKSGAAIDSILLKVEDLPEGWKAYPVDDEGGDSCLDQLFGAGRPFDPEHGATASFGASDNGPFLSGWVMDAAPAVVFAEVNSVLVSCDGATATSGFITMIDPRPLPGLPADSLSFRGSDTIPNGPSISYSFAASGEDGVTVGVFAATPLGQVDDSTIADAVAAMVNRFSAD